MYFTGRNMQLHRYISLSGILCGTLICIGYFSATIDTIPVRDVSFYLLLVVACTIGSSAFVLFDRLYSIFQRERKVSTKSRIGFDITRSFINQGMRILLHWVPYVIMLFPGIIFWDTGDQLAQYFGISAFGMKPGLIWDHHPFFDTYLWGTIISVFKSCTGSYYVGIYFIGIVQCVLAASTFGMVIWYLCYRKVCERYVRLVYYFVCYFPVFPIMFFCIVKDTINVIFFLQWILIYAEALNTKGAILKNKKVAAAFLMLTLLSGLTKKITIYIVVFSLIMLTFFMFSRIIKLYIVSVAIGSYILLQLVFPTFLYPKINVVQGGPQAAITVPIEQVARVAHYYPNDCTRDERQAIDGYLVTGWKKMSQNYNPYTADPVSGFNVRDKSGTLRFLKAWASIGLRHPATYINAFFSQECGWLTFGTSMGVDRTEYTAALTPVQMQVPTHTNANELTFGKLQKDYGRTKANRIVQSIFEFLLCIPGLNIPYYSAVWTCVLPLYFIHRMRIRAKIIGNIRERLLESLPYILSVLSLFLYSLSLSIISPVDPTRYMFHTVVLAPFFYGYTFMTSQGNDDSLNNLIQTQ